MSCAAFGAIRKNRPIPSTSAAVNNLALIAGSHPRSGQRSSLERAHQIAEVIPPSNLSLLTPKLHCRNAVPFFGNGDRGSVVLRVELARKVYIAGETVHEIQTITSHKIPPHITATSVSRAKFEIALKNQKTLWISGELLAMGRVELSQIPELRERPLPTQAVIRAHLRLRATGMPLDAPRATF